MFCKKNCLCLFCLILSFNLFSQEKDIALPDVTTVITSEQEGIDIPSPNISDKNELPDIKSTLIESFREKITDDVAITNSADTKQLLFKTKAKLELSYPSLFFVNFELFQNNKNNLNAFKLKIEHLSNIKSDRNYTNLLVSKDFQINDFSLIDVSVNSYNYNKNDFSFINLEPKLYYRNYSFFIFSISDLGFMYDYDSTIKNINSKQSLHRSEFFAKLIIGDPEELAGYADLSIVLLPHQNTKVVVPFRLGFYNARPEKHREAYFFFGLESKKAKLIQNEITYKHSSFTDLPTEESFFYIDLKYKCPILDDFVLSEELHFKKSAYNNGFWDLNPLLENNANQFANYIQDSKTIFYTDFSLDFLYNNFVISTSLLFNFVDLFVTQNRFNYKLKLSYDNKKWFLGFVELTGSFDGTDKCPIINSEGEVKLNSTKFTLGYNLEDLIKLISLSLRTYKNDYKEETGKISLYIKYNY